MHDVTLFTLHHRNRCILCLFCICFLLNTIINSGCVAVWSVYTGFTLSDAFLWLVHLWLLVLVSQHVIFSRSLVIILSEGHRWLCKNTRKAAHQHLTFQWAWTSAFAFSTWTVVIAVFIIENSNTKDKEYYKFDCIKSKFYSKIKTIKYWYNWSHSTFCLNL